MAFLGNWEQRPASPIVDAVDQCRVENEETLGRQIHDLQEALRTAGGRLKAKWMYWLVECPRKDEYLRILEARTNEDVKFLHEFREHEDPVHAQLRIGGRVWDNTYYLNDELQCYASELLVNAEHELEVLEGDELQPLDLLHLMRAHHIVALREWINSLVNASESFYETMQGITPATCSEDPCPGSGQVKLYLESGGCDVEYEFTLPD